MTVANRPIGAPARLPRERGGQFHVVELVGGFAAAIAVGLIMWLLRSTLQVRSVPERLLEWLLLFVPLDVFEAGLQQFGFSAKRYALYFGVLVMLGALTWLGASVLHRRWPMLALIGL